MGELPAIVLASPRAASITPPASQIELINPNCEASSEPTLRPVKINSMAAFSPIWRVRRCKPPAAANRPTLTSGNAKLAIGSAMATSQAKTISRPPPMATPLTAAITGFSRLVREHSPAKPEAGIDISPPLAETLRSLPLQKAFSPAPVTIATQRSWSRSNSSKISANSKCAALKSAL